VSDETALVPSVSRDIQSGYMPIMKIEVALERRTAIVEFTKRIMVPDQDFGVIPGANKPTLLKPGAEKLCCFFGLEPEFTEMIEDCDWTGERHAGEMFYYIRYRCRLLRDGRVLGVGEGSCNSWEKKYRWRQSSRKCPQCGQEAIIAGKKFKESDPATWLCWRKKGGCNAKFEINDPAIADQAIGNIPNPDIADTVNTIQKMAQKRALVAATLIATGASEFFTQDVEDRSTGDDIDTGDHPKGTQAAADHVANGKIQNLSDPPELKIFLDGIDKNPQLAGEAFDKLRTAIFDKSGGAGAKAYDAVERQFAAKYPKGTADKNALKQCVRALWQVLQTVEPDQPKPDGFDEHMAGTKPLPFDMLDKVTK